MNHIHPTAVIDPGVKIADDVRIGPYAVIGEGVELASGVEIGSHAELLRHGGSYASLFETWQRHGGHSPEPGTGFLLLSGLVGLGMRRRVS